jgi:prepilin-type N-terminal cleavage/methylation domain-containing protein
MKQKGFTLVEILIVMAILSVISLISYSALTTTFKHQSIQKKHSQALNEMQKMLLYLERDFSQVFNQEVTLSATGMQLSSIQNDTLLNIHYEFGANTIKRQDKTDVEKVAELVLLKKVSHLKIRALDNQNRWHRTWQYENNRNHLKAIEIKFSHPYWGEIKQLLAI